MDELADLRGSTIAWTFPQRKPLRGAITQGSRTVGALVQRRIRGIVEVSFAGIRWRLVVGKGHDALGFDDGAVVAAKARKALLLPYEAWVDGAAHYALVANPDGLRVAWIDGAGDEAMVFRRHRFSFAGQTGEIDVSRTAVLEHAPILVLLGLFRISQATLFRRRDPATIR